MRQITRMRAAREISSYLVQSWAAVYFSADSIGTRFSANARRKFPQRRTVYFIDHVSRSSSTVDFCYFMHRPEQNKNNISSMSLSHSLFPSRLNIRKLAPCFFKTAEYFYFASISFSRDFVLTSLVVARAHIFSNQSAENCLIPRFEEKKNTFRNENLRSQTFEETNRPLFREIQDLLDLALLFISVAIKNSKQKSLIYCRRVFASNQEPRTKTHIFVKKMTRVLSCPDLVRLYRRERQTLTTTCIRAAVAYMIGQAWHAIESTDIVSPRARRRDARACVCRRRLVFTSCKDITWVSKRSWVTD